MCECCECERDVCFALRAVEYLSSTCCDTYLRKLVIRRRMYVRTLG